MRRLLAILLTSALGLLLAPGCSIPQECMEPGYKRWAQGSESYTPPKAVRIGALKSEGPIENAPTSTPLEMRSFDPFKSGACTVSRNDFTFSVGGCELEASMTSRIHDDGDGNEDFDRATAIIGNDECTFRLGDHSATGAVTSGELVILPDKVTVVVDMRLRFWDEKPIDEQVFRYRFDGVWNE